MAERPTYEELEQKVRKLESDKAEYKARIDSFKEKENWYKKLYDNMLNEVHVWQLVYDDYGSIKTWKLVDANPAALQSWDKSLSEILGKTTDEIFPNSNATDRFLPVVEKIFAEGKPHTWEDYFPDTKQNLYMISVPIGEFFISTGFDITDRKRAERILLEANLKQKEAVKAGNVGFWDWNLETNKVVYSKEWKAQIGYEDHEISDDFEEWRSRVHPADLAGTLATVENSVKNLNKIHRLEFRFRHRDGSYRWILTQASIIRDKNGRPSRMLGSHIDITEHKKATEDLKNSESLKNLIIESSPDCIKLFDLEGRLKWMSRSGQNLLEIKDIAAYLDKNWIDFWQGRDKVNAQKAIEKAIQGKTGKFQGESPTETGIPKWWDVIITPLLDSDGRADKLLSVSRDISESKEILSKLKKRNIDLRLAQRIASIGTWTLDPEIGIPEWSDEIYRIYERDPDLGPHALADYKNIYKGKWWERFNSAIQGAIKDGAPYDIELKLELPSGAVKWIHSICEPEADSGPKGRILRGTIQDITRHKQTEQTLEKYVQRLEGITNNMFDLVALSDLEGNYTFANKSYERILGYSISEIINRNILDLVHPDDLPEITEEFNSFVKSSGLRTVQYRFRHKHGHYLWFETVSEILLDKNQKPDEIIFSTRDITERKAQDKKLRLLEKRNRALLDHSPVCHKIVDLDFNLQYMSANGFNMLKIDHNSDVYGKPYPFYFFPEEFKKTMTENLRKVRETGKVIIVEALARDTEGNSVWLDSSLIPVFNDEEKIDYVTVVSADTTQRKHDEKEKELLELQLFQAQKIESIGSLAGGIAHDFNNLLFPIIGMSEMLLEDLPSGSFERENAQEIFKAGIRGRDLVQQILAFSRQSKHKKKPVRIQEIIEEVAKLSRSTIPAYIEITQDIQQSCGAVLADASQVYQIVMNIMTNAYHELEDAGGTISIILKEIVLGSEESTDPNTVPEKYALLSISDTGKGMSEEVIGKIFDPYFTTKEQGKGTGLGLAVVYGIVKEHGGDIKVYSEINKGSTFEISFPLMEKYEGPESPPESPKYQGGNERILLVDDEESVANLEKQMLERMGYHITFRLRSMDALEIFKASPFSFDLVISDMSMPGMQGDELARRIKSIRSDIPIIICTGFSEKEITENAGTGGVNGFIMKPISRSEMAKKVRKVLDDAQSRNQG